ncbi:selenoneine biosynthesis selenosugar synthase SenB [Polynucleobacter sp. HIN7]|uniref:selenoneine biosynthesis selenosugar synthase SenB n=1 Tax=Polynucleobacter sp. HIN7 TaxID=3047866 RepID=UPI002573ACD2|nr:selenoneine biosynthesis selenosugar synthase SenB [Polynucleobacter sp. HIN7]
MAIATGSCIGAYFSESYFKGQLLNMRRIEIVTPAPPGSLHGNRVTAKRWQGFLRQLGYRVPITESWSGKDTDLLIALHAYRSHTSIDAFKLAYPNRPLILILTGTDLYRDMANHPEVHESMALADGLVVLQTEALRIIPAKWRHKATVIHQSAPQIPKQQKPNDEFSVSVIGHLRPEKDPFCIVRALPYLHSDSQITIQHLGMAMSGEMEKIALQATKQHDRYTWQGMVSHQTTLRTLARSHVIVISSRMEGGAHVVSEAIAAGVPILASKIAGNCGLLGKDYLGYFPVGNEKALARLLLRAETDQLFYKKLREQVKQLRKLIQPSQEKSAIQKLISKLIY